MAGVNGQTRKTVALSDVELSIADGRYFGSLEYQDILGMMDSAGSVSSQASAIQIELQGVPTEGGSVAGGTFVGTATLILRTAGTLEAASAPEMLALSSGQASMYDVRGRWSARIDGAVAVGEILFEVASLRTGEEDQGVSWFNRASLGNPEGLGLGQAFTTDVIGLKDLEADSDQEKAEDEPAEKTGSGISFWTYLVRGLSGDLGESEVPAPASTVLFAQALKDARPARATELPESAIAIDVDVAGAYLDAKNRAAGLLGGSGPRADGAESARREFAEARAAVPGVAAIPVEEDAGLVYVQRIRESLMDTPDAQGASDIAGQISLVRPGSAAGIVVTLRTLSILVEAVGAPSYGSALLATLLAADDVAASSLTSSDSARSAVRVAADSPLAHREDLDVVFFERVDELDAISGPAGESLPNRVLARHGSGSGGIRSGLAWESSTGVERVAPTSWEAYRRADGAVYWLAGGSSLVALTDASLLGWGWSIQRGALVDAARCGRIYDFYVTE